MTVSIFKIATNLKDQGRLSRGRRRYGEFCEPTLQGGEYGQSGESWWGQLGLKRLEIMSRAQQASTDRVDRVSWVLKQTMLWLTEWLQETIARRRFEEGCYHGFAFVQRPAILLGRQLWSHWEDISPSPCVDIKTSIYFLEGKVLHQNNKKTKAATSRVERRL